MDALKAQTEWFCKITQFSKTTPSALIFGSVTFSYSGSHPSLNASGFAQKAIEMTREAHPNSCRRGL